MRFFIVFHGLNNVLVKLTKFRFLLSSYIAASRYIRVYSLKISIIGEHLERKCLEVNPVIFTSDSERR